MAQAALVGFPVEAGRKLLEKADQSGLTIKSAFWTLLPGEEAWRLILAVPEMETAGSRSVGLRIRAILDNLPESEREDLTLGDMAIVSPSWLIVNEMLQRYGNISSDSRQESRRISFPSTEPFIYRLSN